MKEDKQKEFEKYKVLFKFMYPSEELKSWINKDNFINNLYEDWDSIMSVVQKIEQDYSFSIEISRFKSSVSIGDNNIFRLIDPWNSITRKKMYQMAISEFVKYANKVNLKEKKAENLYEKTFKKP